jgi:hypothetical protein
MYKRDEDGKPVARVFHRCALVDAEGMPCAFPPEHCERCAADETAPKSLDSEVNRHLRERNLARRVEAGDRPKHPGLMALEAAVDKARERFGRAGVEERLVRAVRHGLPPERAQKLADRGKGKGPNR